MKFFKEDKWDAWYNSLSPSTRAYINHQPIWHDRDLFKAVVFGFVVGLLLGLCF
jgi:hypothetical protein